jgi:hypothetical protein
MRSLLRMDAVMTKIPGSEEDVEGWEEAAMWISVNAATVFATTY